MTVLSRLTQRVLTPAQAWGAGIDWSEGNTQAGVRVTEDSARKLLAIWACQRLLTNSISTMPVAVLRKAGDRRIPASDPHWFAEPTTNPNDTIIDHFSDVTMSLLGDGNAFIRGLPNATIMAEYLYALEPQKVQIDRDNARPYNALNVGRFSPEELIHISLLRKPGQTRGMSPIDTALDSIGMGLAAQEFGARFFSNGATLSGVIKSPGPMTPESIENLRDQFKLKHQGVRKSHAFGVLTGGADFKEMTVAPAQAQLLELRKFQIEDIARLYGVPPYMIASQEPGAVAYASVEQRAIDYVQYGVQPLVVKIERAYGRLLPPDHYLKFNLAALLRGDIESRYRAHQIALQNKFMTRNEVRAFEDMEPFDGTDGGLLETPNNNAPETGAPADE